MYKLPFFYAEKLTIKIKKKFKLWFVKKHIIDRRYGIETSTVVSPKNLSTGDTTLDSQNIGYVGSQPSVFRRAVVCIPFVKNSHFIDLGCGKGRILVVATEFGFKSITGIELVQSIFEIAKYNAFIVYKKFPERTKIQLICGDATAPNIPDDEHQIIFFIYNSFGAPLIKKLASHLERLCQTKKHLKFFLMYYNPVHFEIFDSSPFLLRFAADKFHFTADETLSSPFSNHFDSIVIYQNNNEPVYKPMSSAQSNIEITIPNLGADVIASSAIILTNDARL